MGRMRERGVSAKQLKTLLMGLLAEALPELRRFSNDLEIDRIDRDGGRIFLKDGRVFSVELRAEASIRSRRGPARRY